MVSIIKPSHKFFEQIVRPFLKEHFPQEFDQMTCGIFGYGSECLGIDDNISRDHHWGIRIDILMPDEMFRTRSKEILTKLENKMPNTFAGFPLRQAHVKGTGVAIESVETFLHRTIGLIDVPNNYHEWLDMPEEDIIHVINGKIWHSPLNKFIQIREVLLSYYPEPVWLRRISHWCRYFSGMGLYHLNRALLRDNLVLATTSFARAIKLSIELAFLLNRCYFPYEKWLYPFFQQLPDLVDRMDPLIEEAVQKKTSWERRVGILEEISDILDRKMVTLEIIPQHPRFQGSRTSSYRLLEHAYAMIIQKLPTEVKNYVPCWDQVFLEKFHTSYVASIPIDEWDHILNLSPIEK